MATTAGALLLLLILVAILPVLRLPTTRPPWNPKKLPPGVTRSFTPKRPRAARPETLEEGSGGGIQ
jgi:hypothetical protein